MCPCLALRASLVRVFGRVQRVGYRRFVLDSAQQLGLSGHVRNEKDGSVTVFVQGDDAVVEKFIEMLKSPPQPAYVRSVEIKEVKPKPRLKYFTIKPSPLHEELQEGFGAMQSIFIDYWGEFRGFVGEFRDYRQEFRGFVGEFRDYRNEFRDFRQEFRDFRDEFRDYRQEFRGFVGEFRDFREEFRDYRQEFRGFVGEFREFRDESLKIGREILDEVKGLKQEFRDYRGEFRDFRQEFGDFRNESLSISREILETSKEVLGEVKGLRKDLQTILDERLARMERDIAEIKAKIGLT
jgi:acylphosphatase